MSDEQIPTPPTSAAGDSMDIFRSSRVTNPVFYEMWERMSYYGMRAMLVLFMTHRCKRKVWPSQ